MLGTIRTRLLRHGRPAAKQPRAALALTLAAAVLLSGCIGWMGHPPGYGPHHRWNDDADGRPYGPGYRCVDEDGNPIPGREPCPYRR